MKFLTVNASHKDIGSNYRKKPASLDAGFLFVSLFLNNGLDKIFQWAGKEPNQPGQMPCTTGKADEKVERNHKRPVKL